MALRDEEIEVYDQTISCSSNDKIDYLYNELYKTLLRAKKWFNHVNKKNESLLNQIILIEKKNSDFNILVEKLLSENKSYSQFETYKAKINNLTKALQCLTNNKNNLENILENQKGFQNKEGLGFGQ